MCCTSCDDKREQVKQKVRDNIAEVKSVVDEAKLKGAKKLAARAAKKYEDLGMLGLSHAEFAQKLEDDFTQLKRYDAGLRRVLEYARAHPELFPKESTANLTASQRQDLRQIWSAVLDYMRALDGIKVYWQDFHRINPLKHEERHAAAFLAGYTAWLIQYNHGLAFVDLTTPSKPMEVLLDEEMPRWDIPAGAFERFKHKIVHIKALARLTGSRNYAKLQRAIVDDGKCVEWPECNWALGVIDTYHTEAVERLALRPGERATYEAFDIVRDFGLDAWFPVQKGMARWMGDTKVRRLHDHLVTDAQIQTLQQELEPGDIIVARKNWYLSNVGLPGFWPHAELYIGSPEELSEAFDRPAITEAIPALKGRTLTAHSAETYPEAWLSYARDAEDGHPRRVIEAISEGVVFSSLETAAGADYVAAMRPRHDAVARAKAILRAFGYWGRPYDFNFDFLTDETVVCTELVYKAWEPGPDKEGVAIELVEVMGRNTLPANELVRQFAVQRELDEAERQFEFVAFLDGSERAHAAISSTAEAFALSWMRPKWDVMQH